MTIIQEYGLEYELRTFKAGIEKGIPTDNREIDSYIKKMAKHYSSLVQWLEDFKIKFGEFDIGIYNKGINIFIAYNF